MEAGYQEMVVHNRPSGQGWEPTYPSAPSAQISAATVLMARMGWNHPRQKRVLAGNIFFKIER
jgi:hypothetical protein